MIFCYDRKELETMKICKSDFDKLYEELSTLIEDTEVDTSTTVDMRTLNVDNLSDNDWDQIKKASMALCTKFNSDVASWPYQFQLQYNSYQSECLALSLLKEQEVLNKINEMLAKYEATCRVAGSYKFNPNPCEHHILGANSSWYEPSNISPVGSCTNWKGLIWLPVYSPSSLISSTCFEVV